MHNTYKFEKVNHVKYHKTIDILYKIHLLWLKVIYKYHVPMSIYNFLVQMAIQEIVYLT